MADLIGTRIKDWTNKVISSLKSTDFFPSDSPDEIDSRKLLFGDFFLGNIIKKEIGAWDMRASMYKTLTGVPEGYVVDRVIILDDDGIPHINGIYDLTIAGEFMNKTCIRDPYEQGYMLGQPPIINVHARGVLVEGSVPKIKLQHNCPTRLTNFITTKNILPFFNIYPWHDSMSSIDGTTVRIQNSNDGGVSTDWIYRYDILKTGDTIYEETPTVFNRGTKITRIDSRIKYNSFGDPVYQIILGLSKTIGDYTQYNGTLEVHREGANGGQTDYNQRIGEVSESDHTFSSGNNVEGNGTLILPSTNVLSKFTNTAVNRGYVILHRKFSDQ